MLYSVYHAYIKWVSFKEKAPFFHLHFIAAWSSWNLAPDCFPYRWRYQLFDIQLGFTSTYMHYMHSAKLYIHTPFTVNKIGLKSGRFCSDFIRFYGLIEKHTGSPLLMWILGKKQLDVGKEKVPSFGFNGVHCVKIEARRWYDVVLYKQCMFAKFIMWICSYTGPSANVIVVARKKSC